MTAELTPGKPSRTYFYRRHGFENLVPSDVLVFDRGSLGLHELSAVRVRAMENPQMLLKHIVDTRGEVLLRCTFGAFK